MIQPDQWLCCHLYRARKLTVNISCFQIISHLNIWVCTQYVVSAVLPWSRGQVVKCHHLHWKRPFYQLCESKYTLEEGGNFSPHIGIIINAVCTYHRKFSERKRFNSVQINLKEKVKRVSPNFTSRLKKRSKTTKQQSVNCGLSDHVILGTTVFSFRRSN